MADLMKSKCRKRRKVGNDAFWTDAPCVNGEEEDLISLGVSTLDEDDGRQNNKIIVTREARKRQVQEWARVRRHASKSNKRSYADARSQQIDALIKGKLELKTKEPRKALPSN